MPDYWLGQNVMSKFVMELSTEAQGHRCSEESSEDSSEEQKEDDKRCRAETQWSNLLQHDELFCGLDCVFFVNGMDNRAK